MTRTPVRLENGNPNNNTYIFKGGRGVVDHRVANRQNCPPPPPPGQSTTPFSELNFSLVELSFMIGMFKQIDIETLDMGMLDILNGYKIAKLDTLRIQEETDQFKLINRMFDKIEKVT
ncbi:unnamed protein product [Meloidogyne enterolobii]|uniref:Uncharacterized protein n=1 Tax=Meloidogyne enterolobii TaxID=390850 RepID=A0ACB0XX96_MELEN